jgi:hypothetical protein
MVMGGPSMSVSIHTDMDRGSRGAVESKWLRCSKIEKKRSKEFRGTHEISQHCIVPTSQGP